jgi:hypothetical protein
MAGGDNTIVTSNQSMPGNKAYCKPITAQKESAFLYDTMPLQAAILAPNLRSSWIKKLILIVF